MLETERAKVDRVLIALLLLGLVVRIGYLIYYHALPEWDQLTVDNYYHHHWAQSIAGGNVLGDTTYFRAPFYVYCLAALYRLFGDSLWVSRLFGTAVGVASLFLTWLLAKKVFDRRTALVAVTLQAICPIIIYFEGELLLDSLFSLTVQVVLYALLLWIERPTARRLFWVGATLGLAAITRPTALILVVLIVPFVFRYDAHRTLFRSIMALGLGLALCIGPIFIRNLAVAGDPVLIASQAGINAYIGNNPSADGLSATLPEPLGYNWRLRDMTALAEREAGRPLKPGEVSSYWSRQAIDWVMHHPVSAGVLYLKKLYFCFADREISNNRDIGAFFSEVPFLRMNPLTFGTLLGVAAAGLLAAGRRRSLMILCMAVVLFALANSLFFVNSRFRLPTVSLLIVPAAYALVMGVEILRQRKWSRFILPGGVALAVGLASHLDLVRLPHGNAAQLYNSKLLYYYSQHDDRQALECGRLALAVDSTFPETNLNVGNIWLRAGRADSAEIYYTREITAHPARAKGYINLASVIYLRGADESSRWLDSAMALAGRALRLDPGEPIANALALRIEAARPGVSADSLGQLCRIATARSAGDIRVLTEAASALVNRNVFAEAEPIVRQAVNARPPAIETDDAAWDADFINAPARFERRKATAYYLLGFLSGRDGRYDDAVRFSREAISRDSMLSEAYVNLVSGYLSQGNLPTADSSLSSAIKRFPDNPTLRLLASQMDKMTRDR